MEQPSAKRRKGSPVPQNARKRKKTMTPEVEVRLSIQMAARERSIDNAFVAYDRAKEQGIKVSLDSFASIMFLCSGGDDWETLLQHQHNNNDAGIVGIGGTDEEQQQQQQPVKHVIEVTPEVLSRGRSLLEDMVAQGIEPNEICYTALARMEALSGNPGAALTLAKSIVSKGLPPRLRCFTPALVAFAEQGQGARAFEVDVAITEAGLEAGEAEFGRLLQAAAGGGVEFSLVESILERISRDLTTLQPTTIAHARLFFTSSVHKQQQWTVQECEVKEDGSCAAAGDGCRLAAIDLTDAEYEDFRSGIAELAARQERLENEFGSFVAWLEKHGPFGAVVDAANVAFYGQNFESGGFNFNQIGEVVDRLQSAHPELRPLVLLHVNRTKAPPAHTPAALALLERLRADNCFYATPHGSNDDWYWMYAAVTAGSRGLLVSNDEMRDHLFHMLTPRFFGKWKQRHQLRYQFQRTPGSLEFDYPPPFTTCAQKIGDGSAWVLPCVDGTWTLAKAKTSDV